MTIKSWMYKSCLIIRGHMVSYITRCNSLTNVKKSCGFADFTALMDWADDELEELSRLNVEYSGSPIIYTDAPEPTQDEMSVEKISREFKEFEEYNSPKKKCSSSWATAAIKAAEAALNYKVKLSEEQLFTCLPKDLGFADGCEGIHPKKVMDYLNEEGLVEKNDFKGCDKLDGRKKYRFTPNSPEVPTAGGLMNLLANDKKPVFVMMAIDIKKLVYVKDMSNVKDSVKCGGYQPSLYGVLTGYKYYSNTQSGWWEVVTHVIPGEEIVIKIPITSNMQNGNYAGIAAYAFTLSELIEPTSYAYICNESIYPTIDDIPADATNLTFTANSYNSLTSVDFTRFTQLQEIVFEDNSFQSCTNVTIDNPDVRVILIGDHSFQLPESSSRRLSMVLGVFIIKNAGNLQVFTVGAFSMGNFNQVGFSGCSVEVDVSIGDNSFSADVDIIVDDDSLSFAVKIEIIIDNANIPACGEDLVISNEADCTKLFEKTWKTITVNEGLCKNFTEDYVISNYECLQSIEMKKDSLEKVKSLKLSSMIWIN